jgi:hypothetical protein
MDIVKTIVAFLVVSFISINYLDHFDTKLQLRLHVARLQIARDFDLLEAFASTSFTYRTLAADAFTDASRGRDRDDYKKFDKSDLVRRFQDEVFDKYTQALQDVETRFLSSETLSQQQEQLATLIGVLREHASNIHELMKQAIADSRMGRDTTALAEESRHARHQFESVQIEIRKVLESIIAKRSEALAENS